LERLIWILSDGKAGHLSQTRGLAGALVARRGGQIREIDLAGKSFWGKLREIWGLGSGFRGQETASFAKATAARGDRGQGEPDFIIAAGHGTHLPLLLSGWLFKRAKTVVCMKPSLPMSWFDFSVVPRHDLTSDVLAKPPAHIIPTLGALHGVKPSPERPKMFTLILIGGPSKEYGWDEQQVIEQLKTVVQSVGFRVQDSGEETQQKLLLTTSRRTPAGFVELLRRECPAIDVVPVEETARGWVAEKLRCAKAVWVTRDSVSMIYEALGSGASVGLLNMPSLQPDGKKKSRVAKGIEMLETDGWVTPFDVWKQTNVLKSRGALVEIDRVAEKVLND